MNLYFTFFDLEDSSSSARCGQDYVEIFDGEVAANNSLGRLCGNPVVYPRQAPRLFNQMFSSTGNTLVLRFVTDYSNDLVDVPPPKGFQAHYFAEDRDECEELQDKFDHSDAPETVGKCSHYCNNFMGGYQCSCKQGYRLHQNGYTCVGKCSGISLRAPFGTIVSPGYPNMYPKLTDCDWTIETRVGQVIQINFEGEFGIESHYSGTCPYDWLKIEDGKVTKTFCGNTTPASSVVSTGNLLKIYFHSDFVTEMQGFKISYKSRGVFCDIPVPPEHGRIVETYGAVRGNLPFDSVVVFECEVGYDMQGVHKIACLKDGSFDDKVPTCLPK